VRAPKPKVTEEASCATGGRDYQPAESAVECAFTAPRAARGGPPCEEAVQCKGAPVWVQATNKEPKGLVDNNTWTKVKVPRGVNTGGGKWALKSKHDERGSETTKKAG